MANQTGLNLHYTTVSTWLVLQVQMANQTDFNFSHLVLRSTASSVVLNFVTYVYLLGLTLDCQSHRTLSSFIWATSNVSGIGLDLVTYLDLPFTASAFSYTCLFGLTLDCQLNKSQFIQQTWSPLSSHLEKSCFNLLQKHFLSLSLFFCHFAYCPQFHFQLFHLFSYFFIVPSLPRSCRLFFLFFSLSSFLILTNAKCKCHAPNHANECHDRFYQCDMQPLYPNMSLINFEPLT